MCSPIPTRLQPLPPPPENNMQFESGGVYRQNQIIASLNARYPHFSIFAFYPYNNAHADTSGVGYKPSVAGHAGFDYGRANFDVHNRFVLLGNILAPWQLSFAPFLSVNSGTPYNITTGLGPDRPTISSTRAQRLRPVAARRTPSPPAMAASMPIQSARRRKDHPLQSRHGSQQREPQSARQQGLRIRAADPRRRSGGRWGWRPSWGWWRNRRRAD